MMSTSPVSPFHSQSTMRSPHAATVSFLRRRPVRSGARLAGVALLILVAAWRARVIVPRTVDDNSLREPAKMGS